MSGHGSLRRTLKAASADLHHAPATRIILPWAKESYQRYGIGRLVSWIRLVIDKNQKRFDIDSWSPILKSEPAICPLASISIFIVSLLVKFGCYWLITLNRIWFVKVSRSYWQLKLESVIFEIIVRSIIKFFEKCWKESARKVLIRMNLKPFLNFAVPVSSFVILEFFRGYVSYSLCHRRGVADCFSLGSPAGKNSCTKAYLTGKTGKFGKNPMLNSHKRFPGCSLGQRVGDPSVTA